MNQINIEKIDKSKIPIPKLNFSHRAVTEILLILENDFTLKSSSGLRIQINGKKCDGFTYDIGFTAQDSDDFVINLDLNGKTVKILIDPFTAFYIPEANIHFVQDFSENMEGFILINPNQKEFHGKFWKQNQSKIPPLIDNAN